MPSSSPSSSGSHEIRVVLASKGQICLQTAPTKGITSVKSLKLYLQTITNVSVHQQVLLTASGAKLPDNADLSSYLNYTLYLFDKSHFSSLMDSFSSQHSASSLSSSPGNLSAATPPSPSGDSSSAHQDSSFPNEEEHEDDSLQELLSFNFEAEEVTFPPYLENSKHRYVNYQKNFYTHNEYANEVAKCAALCHQKVLKLYQEIKYQYEAIVAATNNLKGHSDRIQKAVKRFHDEFHTDSKRFHHHADHFKENLEKLAKIPLHEKMCTETMHTLKDCVKEPQLKQWLTKCLQELKVFTSHVEQGEKFAQSIQRNVETHRLASPIVDFSELRQLREKSKNLLQQENEIHKKLTEEYDTFHDTFREEGSGSGGMQSSYSSSSSSTTSNDHSTSVIESELKSISEIRQITYNKAKDNLGEMQRILSLFAEKKRELTRDFFDRLRKIASTQYDLRKLTNRYSATFNTVLHSLRKKFSQIELIYYFPGAYHLSCLEIARRREFMRTYENEITKAKNTVDRLREREQALEKKFNRYVGRYMPPQLVPALRESVPKCSIVMEHSHFDQLPEIMRSQGGSESTLSADLQMKEVKKLFNTDFTEKDLKVYETAMDDNLFFEAMNMLNSTMMESRIDDGKSQVNFASAETMYKKKLEQQHQQIEAMKKENDRLKQDHDKVRKEAERAEKARHTHASENDHLRMQLRSIQEKLQHVASGEKKETREKIESLLDELNSMDM